jgi:hypothetical protein
MDMSDCSVSKPVSVSQIQLKEHYFDAVAALFSSQEAIWIGGFAKQLCLSKL